MWTFISNDAVMGVREGFTPTPRQASDNIPRRADQFN